MELATGVAGRLGLSRYEIVAVQQVGLLHDIGKIGIPDSILRKPGALDAAEWALMRQHSVVGAKIVASTESLAHLTPMVRAETEHAAAESVSGNGSSILVQRFRRNRLAA